MLFSQEEDTTYGTRGGVGWHWKIKFSFMKKKSMKSGSIEESAKAFLKGKLTAFFQRSQNSQLSVS